MADTFLLTEAISKQRQQKTPSPQKHSLSPQRIPGESAMEKAKRQWEWTLRKILFTPPTEDFYNKFTIKPGVYFYRALATSRFPTETLQVNIPETVMCFDQTYYSLYTDEQSGCLKRRQDSSYSEFEQQVHDYNTRYIQRFSSNRSFDPRTDLKENFDGPYLISRGQSAQDWNMSKSVATFRQQKERKVTLDNNKLEQRFVVSRAMKATILRLVFYTKNSKSTNANYAWRIMNFRDLFDPNPKKSITNKTTINTEEQNSFSIQLVKGSGLNDYERQAEQIIVFLERSYPVRIRMAVLDFIQDPEGKNWLVNMKYILQDPAVSMNDIQGSGEGRKTLDQLTCSVYCKLCGIIFKKDDASKVLTYKLLWELVQHLKKRNKQLTNIKVSHSSTRPCRVCDMCYMLVVGEHELVEVEQKFALAQNIPLGDAIVRVPMESKPKHRPALLAENLYQWRLLFFYRNISDLEGSQVSDLKNIHVQQKLHNMRTCFNTKLPNSILKQISKDQGSTVTLINPIKHNRPPLTSALSSRTIKSSLPLDSQNEKSQKQIRFSGVHRSTSQREVDQQTIQHDPYQKYELNMDVIRVHYFFSETIDIEKFLNETEIKIRLTNGPEWNNYVGEGSTKTIHHFKNKVQGGQRHSAQVLLFFENSKYCVLNVQVGLFCDGIYNTGKLNLYKYNNIYFPDENYYNCNPFPPEWIEMFDPQNANQRDSFEEKAKEIEAYSPKCTKDELNKMIDFNKYKEKNKYKKVDSIVQQQIREVKSATQKDTSTKIITTPPPLINRTMPLPSGKKKTLKPQSNEIDEQFLLQQYAQEEKEIEADEIIFREENRQQKRKSPDSIPDVSGSSEDEELNRKLNQELQNARKLKKASFQIRQTQSAQNSQPKISSVTSINKQRESAKIRILKADDDQ